MSRFKKMVVMASLVAGMLVNIGVSIAGSVPGIGEIGPYGGIIYYVDSSGAHGLEAKATDETKLLNWNEAVIAASAYGDGWHLPTKTELKMLYDHKNSVGAFAKDDYWSLTELDSNSAWIQGFGNGDQDRYNKYSRLSVRAVRAF